MNCRECNEELLDEEFDQYGGMCADCFSDFQDNDLEDQFEYSMR